MKDLLGKHHKIFKISLGDDLPCRVPTMKVHLKHQTTQVRDRSSVIQ